jgi:excisionase family DNA binding protein
VDRLLLKVGEAAEVAAISRSKAYELISEGTWPVIHVGRGLRVPVAALREWIEQQRSREPVGGRAS